MKRVKLVNVIVFSVPLLLILLAWNLFLMRGRTVESIDNGNDEPNGNGSYGLVYIGNSEVEEILADTSEEGTFIYIGRPGCPICDNLEPILEDVLANLGIELLYFQVALAAEDDLELTEDLIDQMDVFGIPMIVYLEQGEVVDRLTGFQSEETLIEFFESNGVPTGLEESDDE